MQTLKLAIQLIEKSDAQQRPIRTARFLIAVPIAILQIIGYQLSEQLQITVRDLDKAGEELTFKYLAEPPKKKKPAKGETEEPAN